ncbi:aldo/keto reductase [Sulfurimonas autotrophica]|uniref:Aldo/keto reductase n=1 Tax=Sulfurimonas autotrophica (strain ATCC BAA-671 / DSM 16294 / JCM 11897 / OK10) TaxID=563040 RepID=E0UU34_SULAO|nr:aldo/keto reductase [Sulfurimonas autotrophica]ADN08343.1 aldo/keto reductase [Sulfurimonas autotrophica DSM 16294]
MSTFAFGTYRITDENPLHIEALKEAVDAGIDLIDTSTNYTDGGAERAIGKVLRNFPDAIRDKIKIVSKYGYIQGSNMLAHKEETFEDVVEFNQSCYHSIANSFMKKQLDASLERLQMSKIDCYLIHNPEYFILDALNKGKKRDEILDSMYQRLYEAFIGLEEEVKEGRINSYGISSNSFAKAKNDPKFLPYEDLLTLAQNAAQEAGNKKHSFSTVQLPVNIVEKEGLKCAAWAKKQGLRVLANRPLNAQKENLMYRLAEYSESKEYYYYLNELLQACDNDLLKSLYNLIEQMDTNKHKFGWVGEYDTFLHSQIIPHIKQALQNIQPDTLDELLRFVDLFLQEYRIMVAYECSKRVRAELKEEFKGCHKKVQECALEFLCKQDAIDYILVGMRKPSYVQEIMAMRENICLD